MLNRLAAIEAQQRVHTQMLQSLIQSAATRDSVESCELPDDVTLPLELLEDLHRLEQKLKENLETKASLVNTCVNCQSIFGLLTFADSVVIYLPLLKM